MWNNVNYKVIDQKCDYAFMLPSFFLNPGNQCCYPLKLQKTAEVCFGQNTNF